jgi:RNA polymerase sigma-70 factor (ECF subfamily)
MTAKLVPLRDPRVDARAAGPFAELDDDELMRLVRGGRSAAFDELVRRHQRRVLGIAAREVRGSAAARDVAQSVFLQLYRATASYEARGTFTAFLYQIVLNQCRMARRTGRSHDRRLADVAREPSPEAESSSDFAILERERNRDVERALDRLSEKLRVVVVLRYGGDLSYHEIAEVLGVPLGTVKRRLFDALAELRARMEEP